MKRKKKKSCAKGGKLQPENLHQTLCSEMPLQPEFALFASRKSAEIDLCPHYSETKIW